MIRTETKAGSVNVSGEKRKIGKKVFPHSNFSGFFLQILKKKLVEEIFQTRFQFCLRLYPFIIPSEVIS